MQITNEKKLEIARLSKEWKSVREIQAITGGAYKTVQRYLEYTPIDSDEETKNTIEKKRIELISCQKDLEIIMGRYRAQKTIVQALGIKKLRKQEKVFRLKKKIEELEKSLW